MTSNGCLMVHIFHTHAYTCYRQVREIFLNLLIRRLNSWDGRKKVEPITTPTPSTAEAPLRQEATPTPTSQTPVPPPAVTDYPAKAQNTTDPSCSLIHPIPVSAVSAPHQVASNVYQSVASGEVPMEGYGTVRMLSPQPQRSSMFMPTASAPLHHQHPQAHRTLSLPTTLQQRGTELLLTIVYVWLHYFVMIM